MQKILISGRITRDLTLKHTNDNKPLVILPIAVKNNNKEANPIYLDFIVYGEMAKIHSQYLSKGSLINIEGHIYQKIKEENGKKIKINTFYADNVEYLNVKKQDLQQEETSNQLN